MARGRQSNSTQSNVTTPGDPDSVAMDKALNEIAKTIEIDKKEIEVAEAKRPEIEALENYAKEQMAKIPVETHRLVIDCAPLSATVLEQIETQIKNRVMAEDYYQYDGHVFGGQSMIIFRCFNLSGTVHCLKQIPLLATYATYAMITDLTKPKESKKLPFDQFLNDGYLKV
jgi:hypothetical protein